MLGKYCDVPLGLYIVRGDNIVLCGNIDESKEESNPSFNKALCIRIEAFAAPPTSDEHKCSTFLLFI